MKLSKKDFVAEVRLLSHKEPTKEEWEKIWYTYNLYPSRMVEDDLRLRKLHKEQKAEYDAINKMWKEYHEKQEARNAS